MAAAWPGILAAALLMGARPRRAGAGDAEARLRGRMHSRVRDAAAVRHHYDLPPEFYALWLDDSMTYSCAYFDAAGADIDDAQRAKLDLVCRKLRLRPGERLLDVGCGWGSLVLHAVQYYGVRAVGVTLSPQQVALARRRAAELELGARAEFRLTDYRDIAERGFDAVASVGMIEHVSRSRLHEYACSVHRALRPGGRALIHGITCRPGARGSRFSFINTFVFPDGQLEDVGRVSTELERAGLEVRDVENLREHYVLTLQQWVRRLESNWDAAVRIAGIQRARVWRLYMTGSITGFRIGAMELHQTLAVRPTRAGVSGVPLLRSDWYQTSDATETHAAHRRKERDRSVEAANAMR
jgi:cyclopropane-fatty-acyl-phospholipid synthase